jgi:hypothetical protein
VPFAQRWVAHLRNSGDRDVAAAGILVRPHPANAGQWQAFAVSGSNVALWPPIDSDPNGPDVHRDFFESLYYSAAVVGVNTSAQLEAGIVGRPVFTVRAPEFEHSQEGTLHFQHLVGGEASLVRAAASLDEHVAQLGAALRGEVDASGANRRFVRSFIRPHGEDAAAAPIFIGAIDRLARLGPPPPRPDAALARAARPLAYAGACVARALAEDRPLWVHALRPIVTAAVWTAAAGYQGRAAVREGVRPAIKRVRRAARRAVYESGRALGRQWHRARKQARRMRAAASGALRRAFLL